MKTTQNRLSAPDDVGRKTKRLLLRHLTPLWGKADLTDDLSLLNDGLGLDSVEIVDLISDCEDIFGIHIAPEFLAGSPLTIGKLIRLIERHLREKADRPGNRVEVPDED